MPPTDPTSTMPSSMEESTVSVALRSSSSWSRRRWRVPMTLSRSSAERCARSATRNSRTAKTIATTATTPTTARSLSMPTSMENRGESGRWLAGRAAAFPCRSPPVHLGAGVPTPHLPSIPTDAGSDRGGSMSKHRTWIAVATVSVLAMIGTACSSDNGNGDSGSFEGVSLTGAGATFPDPIYEQWFRDFRSVEPGAKINYQAIGSGGAVTKWNAPEIAAQNPGVTLPSTPIAVVHRSDESGTTFVFTSWLASQSPEWQQKVGADKAVQWPTGIGGDGNDGVAAGISQTS